MSYNLDYYIHLSDDAAAGVNAKRLQARAAAIGQDLEDAKKLAEKVIADAGGTTGELYETSSTSTRFAAGTLVSTYAADGGWTDAAGE